MASSSNTKGNSLSSKNVDSADNPAIRIMHWAEARVINRLHYKALSKCKGLGHVAQGREELGGGRRGRPADAPGNVPGGNFFLLSKGHKVSCQQIRC